MSQALTTALLAIALPTALVQPPPTATPSSATPQTSDAVDRSIEEASAAFTEGDYAVALTKFEAAYEVEPDPNFLYNIGRIHEELGDLPRALHYYRTFVLSPGVSLDLRKQTVERIKVLDEVLAQTRPQAEPIPSPPPAAAQPNRALRPTPPRSSDSPPPQDTHALSTLPGRGLRHAGYVVLSGGLATLTAGAVFGGLARSHADNLSTEDDASRRQTLVQTGQRNALAADITLFGGAALCAAGLSLVLAGVAKKRSHRTATLAPSIGISPRGASLALRF